jgi:hypothetical protein
MEFLRIKFGSIWEILAPNPHSLHRSLGLKAQQVRQDLMEQMERQGLPVHKVLQDQLD